MIFSLNIYYLLIYHPMHHRNVLLFPQNMIKPAKSALAEAVVHSGETSTSHHFFVGNLMLPPFKEYDGGIVGGRC